MKRLRNDPRVELRPCGRFGAVEEGAVPVAGRARIGDGPADQVLARRVIEQTYPIESRLVLGLERLVERLRGRSRTDRLALYLTPG